MMTYDVLNKDLYKVIYVITFFLKQTSTNNVSDVFQKALFCHFGGSYCEPGSYGGLSIPHIGFRHVIFLS